MYTIWFKIFFRNAKNNWLNTLINIGGLTLGLTGLIVVLLYYNKESSYDEWNPNKTVLFKVGHAFSDGQIFDDSTKPEGPKSTEIIPEIEAYLTMPSWYVKDLLSVNEKTYFTEKMVMTTDNFFEFFPHPFVAGNPKEALQSKNGAAISMKVKKHLFGEGKALGETIQIGKDNHIVTGVYTIQEPSTTIPEVVIKKEVNKNMNNHWGSFSNFTYYKVKPGTDIKALEKKLQQIFIDNWYTKQAKKDGVSVEVYMQKQGSIPFLEQLKGWRLHSKGDIGPLEGKGNYLLLVIMLGLSLLIIVISCINFINLSIASASLRGKEVGVKKTLGISGVHFTVQYVLEIALQCFIALLLALVMSELLLPIFNAYFYTELHLNNLQLLLQIGILTLGISIGIGLLYATYLSNFKMIRVLKGNFARNKSMTLFRNVMLGLQFMISGFFLIGGLVVYYQVSYMNQKELGFSGEQILVVNLANNENRWKHYQLAKNVFKDHPNILSISTSLETPGSDEDFSNDLFYGANVVDTKFIPADYGHLEMLNATMKEGRTFSEKFASDSIKGMILNETAVKRLGMKNPLQEKLKVFGKEFSVIGVVQDYHTSGFDKKIKPIFYLHYKSVHWLKYNMNAVHFKVTPQHIDKTIAKIEEFWKTELEPGYPFSYSFVNQEFEKTYEKYKQQQTLFTILTMIVIMVALLGLFALATLTIQQRLKEVAIRKTLGASVKEIMYQLIKSFVKIVCVASVFLIPLAYYLMQNWLDNFVYRISMPILPYVIAPLLLIILVIAVVGLKAFNATKVDLIKYLKFE